MARGLSVTLTLVIGNKTYSSWSMRPWLLMRAFEIPFDEIVIPLYADGSSDAIRRYNPAGKVPALVDGALQVWDSLAIMEYLAERHPTLAIWPKDAAARAMARSLSAEMHSGFVPLRKNLPMNIKRAAKPIKFDKETKAEVGAQTARIEAAWDQARSLHGRAGPFLFGSFSAADAMFAPIVSRFITYAIPVGATARDYMEAMAALPAWQDWRTAAEAEGWRIERFEVA